MKIPDPIPFVLSMLAFGLSILSFLQSRRASTSDYQAVQKVKLETTTLIAALRAMMVKGALYTQQDVALREKKDYSRYVDLTAEKKVVQDFLCSATAIAYYSYLTERSKKAGGAGEEWRTFFLQAAELLLEDNRDVAAKRAARLEKLFHPIEAEDFIGISRNVQDLGVALKRLFDDIPHDTVVAALMASSEPELSDKEFQEFVFFLKRDKAVADADVDLFYGVFLNDTSILEDAISRGAKLQTTSGEITARYKDFLSEFRARRG